MAEAGSKDCIEGGRIAFIQGDDLCRSSREGFGGLGGRGVGMRRLILGLGERRDGGRKLPSGRRRVSSRGD
jgi:hypothetical protein